jgi:hypothetical protein
MLAEWRFESSSVLENQQKHNAEDAEERRQSGKKQKGSLHRSGMVNFKKMYQSGVSGFPSPLMERGAEGSLWEPDQLVP